MIEAQTQQQQPSRGLSEEALLLAIKNARLDSDTIKALRLTCKPTKAAANDRVWNFTLTESQEPEAVQRSGLLNKITKLDIYFDLIPLDSDSDLLTRQHAQDVSRAFGLLTLAAEVCSDFLEILAVAISGSSETLRACGSILSKPTWESVQALMTLLYYSSCSMPDFLSAVFTASPASLPALNKLFCRDPSAADMEALCNSGLLGNLTYLSLSWWPRAYETNTAPAMIAAMRNLLQNAINLKEFQLVSSTFEFFDSENLVSLTTLGLGAPQFAPGHERDVDFAPVLARPWKALENLHISDTFLKAADLVRVFEARDTLPALIFLKFARVSFNNAVDGLSGVHRPHLGVFVVAKCSHVNALLSKLTQLVKDNASSLPSLQEFHCDCSHEDDFATTETSIADFITAKKTLRGLCVNAKDLQLREFAYEDHGVSYFDRERVPKVWKVSLVAHF